MSRIPDRELIKRSIDGDSQAFSILIKRIETPLVKLVKSKIPDTASAEDILQEVLLDVWQGLKGLRDPDRWAAWVMQIARNRCHDFFRLAQRREAPMANSDLEPILNRRSQHGSFQADLLDTVLQTLSHAPPDHVEAAHLFYLEGLTIRQIAVQLGKPEGTIKRWLSHTRSFVRNRLGLRQMRIERRKTMTSASPLTGNYPQQNTLCLPPGAVARFGKYGKDQPVQHSQEINRWIAAFSRNGKHLAGLDTDYSLTLWDIENGKKIRTFEQVTGHSLHVNLCRGETVTCSSDGRFLVISFFTTGGQETVRLWNEGAIADFTPEQPVFAAAVSPDGQHMATGGWDRTVTLWNVETQTVYRSLTGHTGEIYVLAFSPDGKFLVSGGADNWIEHPESVTRNTDGELVFIMKEGKSHFFTPDENHIDKTARVWEVATGKNIATLENPSQVRAVAFSPDGHHVAAASNEHVNLWHTGTWQNIAALDVRKVSYIAFSPDGSRLATGGTLPEQTIRLWDVESGNLVAEFSGHNSQVESLAFSPDGRLLASGSFDRSILLWDVTPYS